MKKFDMFKEIFLSEVDKYKTHITKDDINNIFNVAVHKTKDKINKIANSDNGFIDRVVNKKLDFIHENLPVGTLLKAKQNCVNTDNMQFLTENKIYTIESRHYAAGEKKYMIKDDSTCLHQFTIDYMENVFEIV